jgi:hypothetical protein
MTRKLLGVAAVFAASFVVALTIAVAVRLLSLRYDG